MQPDFELFHLYDYDYDKCTSTTECAFMVLLTSFVSSAASKPKKLVALKFSFRTQKGRQDFRKGGNSK